MTSYRIEYTAMKPGGHLDAECESITGTLTGVRDLIDSRSVYGHNPITITEYTASDAIGRIVPDSEWDIIED